MSIGLQGWKNPGIIKEGKVPQLAHIDSPWLYVSYIMSEPLTIQSVRQSLNKLQLIGTWNPKIMDNMVPLGVLISNSSRNPPGNFVVILLIGIFPRLAF